MARCWQGSWTVFTRTEPAEPGATRAHRWLAATRRLRELAPGGSHDLRGQRAAVLGRLRALAAAIRPDGPGARGHAGRVATLSGRLALAIGLSPEEAEVVALSGLLHDIGFLGGGSMADDAGRSQRRHPLLGAQLVAPFDVLALAAPMIRHHHERLDGSGYPDGLRGDAIPVGARIIAVADEYDHLTASAPTAPREAALESLGKARCLLDASIVSALVEQILSARSVQTRPARHV